MKSVVVENQLRLGVFCPQNTEICDWISANVLLAKQISKGDTVNDSWVVNI